jgi:hypothetical protein
MPAVHWDMRMDGAVDSNKGGQTAVTWTGVSRALNDFDSAPAHLQADYGYGAKVRSPSFESKRCRTGRSRLGTATFLSRARL